VIRGNCNVSACWHHQPRNRRLPIFDLSTNSLRVAAVDRPARSCAWRERICALLLLLGGPGCASAEWTGVAMEFANFNTDWKFSNETREAKTNSITLKIEERTNIGLTVGGGIGYHFLSLDGQDGGDSTSFDAQNVEIYLRQEFALGDAVTLLGVLDYAWYTGDDGDEADIDWSEVGVELGVNFRYRNVGITPFVSYTNVDGDTSGLEDGGDFELKDSFGQGVRFDIFVESTAFVSIELKTGSQTGGYIGFVRRY
jgi:hypothetical protein